MFLELHYIVDVWKNEDVLIEENICSSELNCDKLLNSLTDDGTQFGNEMSQETSDCIKDPKEVLVQYLGFNYSK